MKAVVFREFGGPEVLRYEDVPTPEPGPGEVLIKVGACSLNRGPDAMVRSGAFGMQGVALPHVSGADPAGEVIALGEGVDEVEVGARVAVYPILSCRECDMCLTYGENYCPHYRLVGVQTWGGQAEYVVVPAYNVVPIADSLSFEAATTLGISYVTTWHGMITKAGTKKGETVLVMAAGSGVGAAAIQIGAMIGARVLATTGSLWKADRAKELGAAEVFDYTDPDWPAKVMAATDGKGVDVLFDNVVSTWSQSLNCLARGGRMFNSGITGAREASIDVLSLYRNMNTFYFYMEGTKQEMVHLADLMGTGQLTPAIDSVFPLSESAAAQAKLDAKQQFGKIVLKPEWS